MPRRGVSLCPQIVSDVLGEPNLVRGIGVVYLPRAGRQSHYFEARPSKQSDAVI